MRIATVKANIIPYLQKYQPNLPLLGRTARSFLPLGVAAAATALGTHNLYENWPAFQQAIDTSREFLSHHQKLYEIGTAAVLMGGLSDLLAQRYATVAGKLKKINWWRLARMTAFGGLTGGVMFRAFFNYNISLFPDTVDWHLAKRVTLDQGPWAMSMLAFVLTGSKFLIDLSFKDLIKDRQTIAKKYFEMLPINWLVWGGCFCWITYSAPSDLMIYISSIFGTIWRAFVVHQAFIDLSKANGHSEPTKS